MNKGACLFAAALSCIPLEAAVTITGITSSLLSPQRLGTPVTLNVTATDTNAGPLTFQFNVGFGSQRPSLVRDFNVGTLSNGVWANQTFQWSTIQAEGPYTIQVVAKDFKSGETAVAAFPFTFTTAVAGGALTVVPTTHPLVALAAVPPCPVGESVRVLFSPASGPGTLTQTPFQPCQGPLSSNFYLGGMYANTTYNVSYQIQRHFTPSFAPALDAAKQGTRIIFVPGVASFTTGPLPSDLSVLDSYVLKTLTAQTDATGVLLHSNFAVSPGLDVQASATDRNGTPLWFFPSTDYATLLTRALAGGHFFVLQSGPVWYGNTSPLDQTLRQIDLTGNVLKETNIGILQQKLLAVGATDLQACGNIPFPAAVGSACLEAFNHDAILLPNGNWAFIANIERITAPGTQGDATGLNYDVLGDAIVVLDDNLDPVWYWDAFQHDGGGTQLDINRAPRAADTCVSLGPGCPPMALLSSPGVAPVGSDWMHSNSLFYNKADGDFILSVRAQDWVLKINYSYGVGNGAILWRMGNDGDFSFNNTGNDPYPWFTHQHDVGLENNGVMTLFDNGNTRIGAYGGNSRGMALAVNQQTMQVTPVFVQDMGYFAPAVGSAQLLSNGDYFFHAGLVAGSPDTYSFEFDPSGNQVYGLEGDVPTYRCFRMFDIYSPPPT